MKHRCNSCGRLQSGVCTAKGKSVIPGIQRDCSLFIKGKRIRSEDDNAILVYSHGANCAYTKKCVEYTSYLS